MASRRNHPRNNSRESPEIDAYLSDESDFYGTASTIQSYNVRASQFSVTSWWENHRPCLTSLALSNLESSEEIKSATLYNPYEGRRDARQLDESVEDFLTRLPPADTAGAPDLEWIFIANPYEDASSSNRDFGDVGAGLEKRHELNITGARILDELKEFKTRIEGERKGQAQGRITRAYNVEKEGYEKRLLEAASNLGCTSGKWMLFCSMSDVDAVWSVIARQTAQNDLGTAAKVTPSDGDIRKERLVCIYTRDFNDIADVTRVLKKLKALGIVDLKGKPLYYKCDAYSYLGITSSNEWSIKASLYNSRELLESQHVRDVTIEEVRGSLRKRKRKE